MCEAGSQRDPLKKGTLRKRPRGQKSNGMAPPNVSFQKRFFVLTEETFEYFKLGKRSAKKTPQGSLMVKNIRAVEEVKSGTFDSERDRHCFQVNFKIPDKDGIEYLYLQASSKDLDGWISALRRAAKMKGNPMLSHYHSGAYRFWKWTCCNEKSLEASGCTAATSYCGEESGFEDSMSSGGSYDVGTMKGTETRDPDTLTRGLELTMSVSSTSTLTNGTLSPDLMHSFFSMEIPEIDSAHPVEKIADSAGSSNQRYHARDKQYVRCIPMSAQNTLAQEKWRASSDSGLGESHYSLQSDSNVSDVETSRDKSASFDVSCSPSRPNDFDQSQKRAHLQSKPHTQLGVTVSVPVQLETLMENGTADTETPEMKKHSKEEKRTHTHTPCIQQPARTIQAAEHPIKSCVFVSQETIAYVPESYKVIIYSTSKGKVLYDVELTYQVASLDVWENYVLVGSCPVQIFRLEEKRLRRIIVIDPEDDLTIEDTTTYIATFLPGGYFATASRAGNTVVIWPPPTNENSLISKTHKRVTIGNESDKISSMWVSGDWEHPVLVVERENLKSVKVLDALQLDCTNYANITSVQENISNTYSPLKKHERKKIQKKYNASVEAVGRCQSSLEQKPVALSNGLIVLYDEKTATETPMCSFSSEKNLEISSLVCMDVEGSTMIAAGFENGDIELWGRNLMKKVAEDSIDEIQRLNVFLGDSFYQESMFYHEYEFTVDHLGGKFMSYPSYSLEIPRGAVLDGKELTIKTGILKYGVFWPSRSPDNIEIVSPIVFFLSNDPDMVFQIPAMLELQHCCIGEAQGSLVLLKADHRNFTLEVVEDASVLASIEHRDMCSSKIRHFCVFCFGRKKNEDGVKTGYTLIPIERKGYVDNTHEVTFCLTYNLETCNHAVREQYVGCDYTIWPSLEVIFSGPPIGIEYTNTELNEWLIADKSKMRQLKVEDLNWEKRYKDQKELLRAHKNQDYPPRFILECCGNNVIKGITLNVRLNNVAQPVSYDINLYKPAIMEEGRPEVTIYPREDHQKEKSLTLSSCPSFHRFNTNVSSD